MEYGFLKLIHRIAVMLFLGNIITGLFRIRIAVKTQDLKIINFAMKGIIKADRYFTVPGVIIITIGGILAAAYGHFPIWKTGWIFWSIIMCSISGIVFSIKLVPVQKKIYTLTKNTEGSTGFNWRQFNKLYSEWDIWGLIAVATPLAVFVMMILKIPQ